MLLDRLGDLLTRLATYRWWEVAVELAVIWLIVFAIVRFVQGTRAAGALKGLLLVVVLGTVLVRVLGGEGSFQRLAYLYERIIGIVAIALVVVFQPELRRLLIRLGEGPGLFRGAAPGGGGVLDAVSEASVYLAKARFGALVVLERQQGLKGLLEGGTEIDASVSARLLQTIFFPGSALHDLATVIRDGRIVAAGVQLPLADPGEMPDPSLGSRHRAAVGLTKESDALVVIVSEETGNIRLAERGRLSRAYKHGELRDELARRMGIREERDEAGEQRPPESGFEGDGKAQRREPTRKGEPV